MSQLAKRKKWFERNKEAEKLEAEGKPVEALRFYEENAAEGCDVAYTYERMAAVYRSLKQYGKEVEALEKAVEIEKERGPNAQVLRLQERLDTSREIAKREGTGGVLSKSDGGEGGSRRKTVKKKEKKGCLSVVVLFAGSAVLAYALLV